MKLVEITAGQVTGTSGHRLLGSMDIGGGRPLNRNADGTRGGVGSPQWMEVNKDKTIHLGDLMGTKYDLLANYILQDGNNLKSEVRIWETSPEITKRITVNGYAYTVDGSKKVSKNKLAIKK